MAKRQTEDGQKKMTGKWMLLLALGAVAGAAGYEAADSRNNAARAQAVISDFNADGLMLSALDPAAGENEALYPPIKGFAGKFLASHFAQSVYDWKTAAQYLDGVLAHDPENFDLTKRAMVLEMGTGNTGAAAARAQTLLKQEPDNGFAYLIIAVDAMARKDLEAARDVMTKMPDGDMTSFAKPLLLGWAEAGRGQLEISGLAQVPMHLYHGALIALILDNKVQAKLFVDQMMQIKGLTPNEAMRVADMLAALGEKDKALGLYQGLKVQEGDFPQIDEKIAAVESGDAEKMKKALPPLQITDVQQGAALALYDMAFVLFQEQSDSSTKLFTQMAIAIDPNLTDARLLLAEMLVRNERLDEAIAILKTVPVDYPSYMEAQRHAADLLAEAGRQDEALAMMNELYKIQPDVETLIRIGDIYRRVEDYREALKAYNRAVKAVGTEPVPEEYWHLLYARGMVHEREGNWEEAVADLQQAMTYRPNHPYLLNYLGYGWADKGENLDQSLELIRRAAGLRPMDGYITDSLGWVLYRMGQYEEAVPHLERAVELLPYDSTINEHLGDAYWQVGRRLEARFQWRRAINSSEDPELAQAIEEKLHAGLPELPEVRSAESTAQDGDGTTPVIKNNKKAQ